MKQQLLQEYLEQGLSAKVIADKLGVTRARVYQLFTRYDIKTPERHKHGYWKQQSLEEQWLWKHLSGKLDLPSREIRFALFNDTKHLLVSHCPVLGLELDYDLKHGGVRTDNSPSIDRIDNEVGYEASNLCVISWRANRIKNDGNAEEHKKIAEYILKTTKL